MPAIKAAAAARAEREKTLAELQADKEKLDAREKELEEQRHQIEQRVSGGDGRDRETGSAARAAAGAAYAAVPTCSMRDLLRASSQIATLQQLAAQEKNATRQQQYVAEANALSLIASRVEADLLGVNRLLRGVAGQRSALQARRHAGAGQHCFASSNASTTSSTS